MTDNADNKKYLFCLHLTDFCYLRFYILYLPFIDAIHDKPSLQKKVDFYI